MLVTSKFQFGTDFFEEATNAICEAFQQNGYPPNAVWVQPTTDIAGNTSVSVLLVEQMHQIPIMVRDDIKIGFHLAENEALLDVCDPNSNLVKYPNLSLTPLLPIFLYQCIDTLIWGLN